MNLKKKRKLRTLDTKSKSTILHRAAATLKRVKSRIMRHPLMKQPLFLLLVHIVVLYAIMIPVFYGCRPDKFLLGQ